MRQMVGLKERKRDPFAAEGVAELAEDECADEHAEEEDGTGQSRVVRSLPAK